MKIYNKLNNKSGFNYEQNDIIFTNPKDFRVKKQENKEIPFCPIDKELFLSYNNFQIEYFEIIFKQISKVFLNLWTRQNSMF